MSIVSDVGHRELVSSRPNCRKMTDPMSTENDYQCSDCVADKIENGRNKHIVKCLFCPSHILNPGLGTYLKDKVRRSDRALRLCYLNLFWLNFIVSCLLGKVKLPLLLLQP